MTVRRRRSDRSGRSKLHSPGRPDSARREELLFRGRVEEHEPQAITEKTGPIDLLLASPECTNHSCARGKRPRVKASQNTAFQVIRYARAMKPRWLVIENVIDMRPWSRYPELLQSLRDEGYAVAEHVLDSADHGVPQKRKRLFIICDRECEPPSRIPKHRGTETNCCMHFGINQEYGAVRHSTMDDARLLRWKGRTAPSRRLGVTYLS